MGDVITHPRFAREKVVQPNPRLRRGTASFRAKYRARSLELARAECLRRERDRRAREINVDSRDLSLCWIDGSLNLAELIDRLGKGGLVILPYTEKQHGTQGALITKRDPLQSTPD